MAAPDLRGLVVVGERAAEVAGARWVRRRIARQIRLRVLGRRHLVADVDLRGLQAVLAAVRAVPDVDVVDARDRADVDLPPRRAISASSRERHAITPPWHHRIAPPSHSHHLITAPPSHRGTAITCHHAGPCGSPFMLVAVSPASVCVHEAVPQLVASCGGAAQSLFPTAVSFIWRIPIGTGNDRAERQYGPLAPSAGV